MNRFQLKEHNLQGGTHYKNKPVTMSPLINTKYRTLLINTSPHEPKMKRNIRSKSIRMSVPNKSNENNCHACILTSLIVREKKCICKFVCVFHLCGGKYKKSLKFHYFYVSCIVKNREKKQY